MKAKEEQTKLASERQSALEAAAKERDALKKTASDRAGRIAELEAQVSDQAERQKQIDEQMIRAETQLEMLKEFMQPAFQWFKTPLYGVIQKYAIGGATAAGFHGEPLATRDIDVFCYLDLPDGRLSRSFAVKRWPWH